MFHVLCSRFHVKDNGIPNLELRTWNIELSLWNSL